MLAELGCLILVAVIAWVIFAVVIFPLMVMTAFALPYILPYLLGVVALYMLLKYIRRRV